MQEISRKRFVSASVRAFKNFDQLLHSIRAELKAHTCAAPVAVYSAILHDVENSTTSLTLGDGWLLPRMRKTVRGLIRATSKNSGWMEAECTPYTIGSSNTLESLLGKEQIPHLIRSKWRYAETLKNKIFKSDKATSKKIISQILKEECFTDHKFDINSIAERKVCRAIIAQLGISNEFEVLFGRSLNIDNRKR